MLFLFRNNQISTAILLAVYVLLTHLAAISGYLPLPHSGSEAGGLLYGTMFGWIGGHSFVSALFAAMLVFLQGFMVNQLADTFRLLGERNWLPGLFYVLAASAVPEFLFLTPALVAATFIPLTLRKIFKCYKTPDASALIFDAGFWITAGALFYPPVILLAIAAFVGVNIMRSFKFQEQLIYWIGLLVPFFLVWLYYFWNDRGLEFWLTQTGQVLGLIRVPEGLVLQLAIRAGFLALLLLIVLFNFGLFYRRKLIQTQKCITTLYLFIVIGVLSVFLQPGLDLSHIAVLAPGVGIFLSMWMMHFRRQLFAEIFHAVLLAMLLMIQYFPG